MSTEQVKAEIRRFLQAEDKLALCLRGKWGVGKTYTWDSLLKECFKSETAKPPRYAYVSLFGLETLGDVRRSLFENTVDAAAFKALEPLEATMSSVASRLTNLASRWRAGTGVLRGIPVISDYAGMVEKAGFLDVHDQIVCFDDLERKSESLNIKDVLGLMSLLKEKKRCKVVLLLNSEALNEKEAEEFAIQLEKIVDVGLVFEPTASEAVGTAIPDRSTQLTRLVANNTTKLEITNIRTIFKLLRVCGRLVEILNNYDSRVVEQAIHSACLFGFAVYQPNDAPSIDDILDRRTYAMLFAKKEDRTPEQIQASELLRRYGFQLVDGLDLAILNAIRNGIYDEENIKKEANTVAESLAIKDKDAAFSGVWDIYHGSFDDNANEFVEKLKQSIKDNAVAITPANLSSSITLLKKLGHGHEVSEIIAAYIEARKDTKELFVGDPILPRLYVEDPDVAAAFSSRAAEFLNNRTLQSATADIVRNRGCDDETLIFIDKHTVDEIFGILKSTKGEDLHLLIYGLTYFRSMTNASPRMKSISEKAVEALKRIGRESEINRLRVEKFGVDIKET